MSVSSANDCLFNMLVLAENETFTDQMIKEMLKFVSSPNFHPIHTHLTAGEDEMSDFAFFGQFSKYRSSIYLS